MLPKFRMNQIIMKAGNNRSEGRRGGSGANCGLKSSPAIGSMRSMYSPVSGLTAIKMRVVKRAREMIVPPGFVTIWSAVITASMPPVNRKMILASFCVKVFS